MSSVIKTVEALAASLIAIFAPIQATLMTAFCLVVADLITGVWVAIKQKQPIVSSGIKRTVLKLLVYEILICLSFLVDKYLTMDTIVVLNMVTSIIGITELKSVAENINIISGGSMLDGILKAISAAQGKTSDPPEDPPPPPAAA